VGAKFQKPAIAFSAPGTVYSRRKLGVSLENINRFATNIIPARDLVPKMDKQGGLIQNIFCSQSIADCHSLRATISELSTKCEYISETNMIINIKPIIDIK